MIMAFMIEELPKERGFWFESSFIGHLHLVSVTHDILLEIVIEELCVN